MMLLTSELAEICGIHAGDGYLRKRGGKTEIEWGGSVEEKGYYDNHIVSLFRKAFDILIRPRHYAKGTYGVIIMDRKVASVLNSLGFPYWKKSQTLRVPREILISNDGILFSRFLRGLFDTDGHLGFRKLYGKSYNEFKRNFHSYPTIILTTISEGLAGEIKKMLDYLGFGSFVYSYQPKNPKDKINYRVIVNGVGGLERWINLIGSRNPVKLSRYLVWKKYGFCPTRLTLRQREDLLNGKLHIKDVEPVS